MSASVVLDRPAPLAPEPVDVACATGAEGARGGCAGAVTEDEAGSAPGSGGTDGTRSGAGGVGATGFVELGLFVHASSSKPDAAAAEFDLDGACTGEVVLAAAVVGPAVGLATSGVVERAICSEAVEIAPRSTLPGIVPPDLLGVGRPLRAFLS
jgi:hypothetical protein